MNDVQLYKRMKDTSFQHRDLELARRFDDFEFMMVSFLVF